MNSSGSSRRSSFYICIDISGSSGTFIFHNTINIGFPENFICSENPIIIHFDYVLSMTVIFIKTIHMLKLVLWALLLNTCMIFLHLYPFLLYAWLIHNSLCNVNAQVVFMWALISNIIYYYFICLSTHSWKCIHF